MSFHSEGSWEDDDEEEEEDDEGQSSEYRHYKDHVIILIDARPPMFQLDVSGKRPFQTALEVTVQLMKRKVLASTGDKISVRFFGVNKARGKECDEKRHELKPLSQPYSKDIRDMDSLVRAEDLAGELELESAAENNQSLTMALRDCSRDLQAVGKESFKRIWLFTTEDHPLQGDKLARAVEDAREADVDIQVWFFSLEGKPFDRSYYDKVLTKVLEDHEEEEGRVEQCLHDASGPLDEVKESANQRDIRKRRYAKIPFTVPSDPPMTFEVALYKMHQVAKRPAAVNIDIKDNSRLTRKTQVMDKETGSKVAEHQLTYFVKLPSGERVYFHDRSSYPAELPVLSERDKGITLLSFLPRSKLDWAHQIKSPTFVYPDEQDLKGGRKAFASLLKAMLDKDCMALVRYTRKPSAPRLAVLLPQDEQVEEDGSQVTPPGMQLLLLPYADDMRDILLPPPVDVPKEAQKMAHQLVDTITLEDFDSTSIANPILQKYYSLVEANALGESKCMWDESQDDETLPRLEEVQEEWGDVLRDLMASCTSASDLSAASGGKKRGPSGGGGGGSSSAKRVKTEVMGECSEESIKSMMESGDIVKCTVKQLQEFCTVLGLTKSGKKQELIEKIQTFF